MLVIRVALHLGSRRYMAARPVASGPRGRVCPLILQAIVTYQRACCVTQAHVTSVHQAVSCDVQELHV